MTQSMKWLFVSCTLLCGVAAFNGEPNCLYGRSGVANLFMWKWTDVRNECADFLGPNNFCAVQVSPVNENQILLVDSQPPWFQRWRPVSYKLDNRGGLENDLREMITECNLAGVRVYMDIVMNHMTDALTDGYGSAGSYYQGQSRDYPGVPYSNTDFHQPRSESNPSGQCPHSDSEIHDHNSKEEVRFCRYEGLNDLLTSSEKVRDKIASFANNLIDMGVAGFRIDTAKYIDPVDIQSLVNSLKTLNPGWFPPNTPPYVFSDVTDLTATQTWSSEYTGIGRVTEYRYGIQLGDYIRKNDNKNLSGLRNFGNDLMSENLTTVFVDNHLTQRGLEIGGFKSVITFHDPRLYQIATAFMLAWPFGFPQIMSSYEWPRNIVGDQDQNEYYGPPFNATSLDILDVAVNPDGLSCGNGWRCEHRMRPVWRMVDFRNKVAGTDVNNWWDNGADQIAFGRSNKGFIVINNEANVDLQQPLQTGLPAGVYCDVISSTTLGSQCDGTRITVDATGNGIFSIPANATVPIIAITT